MIINTNQALTFVPNKQFAKLINISPHSLKMMEMVNSKFSSVEVWFTEEVSKVLKIEDNVKNGIKMEFQRLYFWW